MYFDARFVDEFHTGILLQNAKKEKAPETAPRGFSLQNRLTR
jgi:hypothetical protein